MRWGESQPLVRAVVITGSRAVPGGPVDRFSDYGVILALADILPIHQEPGWLDALAPVLVIYLDPISDTQLTGCLSEKNCVKGVM